MALVKTIGPASVLPAEGFDNYLSETAKISVPFTTIKNRAKIINLAADAGVRFGVNRIQTQAIIKAKGEFGPNDEFVHKLAGDKFDQVRFVGEWVSDNNIYGPRIVSNDLSEAFVEITFFGTGLNYLTDWNHPTNEQKISIDGGPESSYTIANQSAILSSRQTSPNCVVPVASELPLGIHTVKIKSVAGSLWLVIHGLEILNESTQLDVRPSTAYINGSPTSIPQTTTNYNSDFTNISGVAGTRGSRVLVYSGNDGVVKKDVQYTNVAKAVMAATDHSNEEVIRTINWRAFGAGRFDDFSYESQNTTTLAFTLDDGTTSLFGSNVYGGAGGQGTGLLANSLNAFFTLTFVGTGLDLSWYCVSSNPEETTVFVDGVSAGTLPSTTKPSSLVNTKICSGLPYGTHTVKILTTVDGADRYFRDFTIYQPKTPELPADSISLATYNLVADYNKENLDPLVRVNSNIEGLIYKSNMREMIYEGAWGNIATAYNSFSGFRINQTSPIATVYHTFTGTGCVFNFGGTGSGNRSFKIYVDDVLYDGASFIIGTGTNDGAGVYSITSGGTQDETVEIVGLPLGSHKVSIENNGSSGLLYFGGFSIITPVHSTKQTKPTIQNALEVGSTALADTRVFKTYEIGKPNWVRTTGVGGGSTTSLIHPRFVPIPHLSCTIKTEGGPIEISYASGITCQGLNEVYIQIYVDGVAVNQYKWYQPTAANYDLPFSDSIIVPVDAGFHTVQVKWCVSAGTANAHIQRDMTVVELK